MYEVSQEIEYEVDDDKKNLFCIGNP
jgi:hypothetical protein